MACQRLLEVDECVGPLRRHRRARPGVSFDVDAGQIVGLIGPNGAGKTTLFNCLSRLYAFSDGARSRSTASRCSSMPPHRIAALGIGRTFQNLALFRTMSVLENVMVGRPLPHAERASSPTRCACRAVAARGARDRRARRRRWSRCSASTRSPTTPCRDLPFGTQKRVELGARAGERAEAAAARRAGRRPQPRGGRDAARAADPRHPRPTCGLTMLLVEHHMNLVMSVSDQVVALDFGRKIADGTPAEVQRASGGDPRLSRARGMNGADGDCRGRCSTCATCTPATARRGCCTASASALAEGGDHHPARRQRRRQDDDCCARSAAWSSRSGEIRFAGERIDGQATEDIVRLGIAHVPDGRGTFVHLTIEENLRLGAYARATRPRSEQDFERIYGYFPRLTERRHQQAGTLSGGEQQMLAVSRALMLRPRLLLLDEPSFGLAPLIVREMFEILRAINERERVEHPAGRAERGAGARARRPRLPARDRPRRDVGHAPTTISATTTVRALLPRLLGARDGHSSCTRCSPASPPAASTPASRWRW